MSFRFILNLLFITLLALSCNSSPRKSDIRKKIIGTYCNENHTLIISDSTYKNIKKEKGVLEQTPYQEFCEGKYIIDMKEGRWILHFLPDSHPHSIANCEQEYTIWTEKEGYLLGTKDELTLRDLFDNTPVSKKNCK